MSTSEHASLETRLAEALDHDARIAMAMTDTARELERFERATMRRRIRRTTIAAVAVVMCILAGAVGAVVVLASNSATPARPTHRPSPHTVPTHKITADQQGPATPLPASVAVTTLRGPQNLGALAFGDLWATTGRDGVKVLPRATLYRISADGRRVLSTASYPKVNDNQPDPVQVGHSIVVADRRGGYTVFSSTGKRIGSLASTSGSGAIAGEDSGGWIVTTPNEVARLGVNGRRIGPALPLPLRNISALAVSPGELWVTDMTLDELVRIDPSTGAVTGRTHLDFAPIQVRYLDGAVYVTTNDDNGLHRIDATTMALTATTVGPAAYPFALPSYGGQVWTQALGGTVTQLDPLTLRTVLTTRVFPELAYEAFGAVIGPNRLYITDGEVNRLYSYPIR